jgi:hypothetical protein
LLELAVHFAMGILARQPERKKGAVIDVHLVRDPFLRAFFLVALLNDCGYLFLSSAAQTFTETVTGIECGGRLYAISVTGFFGHGSLLSG